MFHLRQRSLDPRVRDKAEEWRLFQLYGQALTEGPVEHGIACCILEVREDNRVFVRESRRGAEEEVARNEKGYENRGGG